MSFGGPQEVGSVKASVGLDASDFKRGLDQARQGLAEHARMTQDALRFTNDLARGFDREAEATRRASLAKQQQTALERELAGAKAQLGAALANEDRIVGQVRAKYSLLSEARRAELIEVKQQIAAQDALAASAVKAANAQAAAQRNLGRNLQTAGRGLTGAVTTPIVGAALAAGYAGQQVQQAEAGIRAGTGLTGGALQGVEESFRRIAPQVSQPLAEVGQAVTELERRTGLTGTALEKLAVSELNLQRITQSGKEIFKDSAQLFTAWNVPVAQQIPLLDEVNRAHQLTGISVTKLLESVAKTAPTFQLMGKSVEDSIATFSAFNKVGIVPERLITALNTAMGKLAKAGAPDVGKAMADMLQRIQNLKDPTEALSEAVRLFGARGGTQLAKELRNGTLSLDQLENSIKHGSDTIAKAAKDTETFSVVWGKMRNAVEIALAPLGEAVLKLTILVAQALKPAVEWLTRLLEAFGKLSPGTQRFILGALGVLAALGPLVNGIGGLIATFGTLKAAWTGITLAFGETEGIMALPLLLNPITGALVLLAAAVLAVTTNWNGMGDAFRMGKGTLERLPGNLQAGYGAMGALRRSAQESIAENAPQEDVWADVGMVRVPDTPQITRPQAPQARVPGLTPEERAALAGGGKQSPLDREQKAYTEELAQARAKLVEVMAGEDKIAAQVAGKYHLLTASQRANLTAVLEQVETYTQLNKVHDQMDKNSRLVALLQRGETVEVARAAVQYDHLSLVQLRSFMASQKAAEAAVKAAESHKAYTKDLEKLNAEIRRLKAGHDAEAGGLDALKEKYPGLSAAMLQHMFATQQVELHLQKLHAAQKQVNDAIREAALGFAASTAQTNAGRVALELYHQKWLDFLKDHPAATSQQFWPTLTPAEQRRAKDQADVLAGTSLNNQLTQMGRENAGLATGQRTQYLAQTTYGRELSQLDPDQIKQINATVRGQDLHEQRQAGFDAFTAPIHQANQLIGTVDEQLSRLGEQFRALTGPSSVARETMAKFGVVLKDLPKDTQQSVKGFFQLQHSLEFVQNFASGVQGVFNQMFSNLAEHGFKGFFKNVVQGFDQMLQKMAADYLSSQLANVFMNLLGGVIGSAFGGKVDSGAYRTGYASGGDYSGRPFWAGEEGPELVVPRGSGTVIPHAQSMALAGAGGHTTINLHVHGVSDVQSFRAPHNQAAIFHDLHREMDRARKRSR